MTPGARVAAAIEVIADIEARRRPAADALKDWGLSHRFAGSGDRAAIAGLAYDALRRRGSSAYIMGQESPRAVVLGMLRLERKLDTEEIARLADGARFSPPPLTDSERARLEAAEPTDAPPWVAGDYPKWLDPYLARAFGDERAAEGAALARRAPLDLRVNTLKAELEKAAQALAHLDAAPTRWSPLGLRIRLAADAKNPAIHAEPAFIKGLVEIQDEGSQLAALLTDAKPGAQVVDLCAGAGGKTLALAAMMEDRGQVYATDQDKRRLAPIHARLSRAGAHNIQVRTPRGQENLLGDLQSRALELRVEQQAELLDRAALLVKPGGRLVYVTCSILAEENADQVRAFLVRRPEFSPVPPPKVTDALGGRALIFRQVALMAEEGLLMTPRRTDTDGFYVAVLRRGG